MRVVYEDMKLSYQELLGLKEMIAKLSKKTIEKYKIENKSTAQGLIVFAGDSMIEYLDIKTYLPEANAINRGVAGATTKSLLDAFDDILDELNPRELFISIGSNDLVLLESSVDEIVLNIKKVFDKINEKFPFTTIYYLSTTPVISEAHKLYKKIYVAGRTNGQNKEINTKVKELCDNHSVIFINQFNDLLDKNGFLEETYTADGIHLNKNGYQIYSSVIREILRNKVLCLS